MMRGIAAIRPGATTGDIGHAIQTYVEAQHMSVVRDFCGHGLGRLFHDEPNIVHVGRPGEGIVLEARHVLHGRADDQSRPPAREGAVRRLDRGDARPLAVGAVRAHGRRHRDRRRGLHLLARQARQAALSSADRSRRLHSAALQSCHGAAGALSMAGKDDRNSAGQPGFPRRRRIITATASGCARASARPAARRSAITSCSSWCCSAPSRSATSSRWPRS